MAGDLEQLSRWLQGQRAEIEETILARAYGISDPATVGDPEYVSGLRAAVSAAVEHGLLGIERGESRIETPPKTLLDQARRAARSGVGLDTVLRRYIAGHLLLGDFAIRGLEDGDWDPRREHFKRLWRINGALLDSVVEAIATEYRLEIEQRRLSTDRLGASVKRLLDGELVDPAEISYPLDSWHIGAVARGAGARAILSDLAGRLDRRLLLIRADDGALWAWLGGREPVASVEAERLSPAPLPDGVSLALGESERGLAGWRQTHHQAKAADRISLRSAPRQAVRYSAVLLLASAINDEVLTNSLQRLYLDPLAYERDGGASLRKTLRAYLAAHLNVSSAAAGLGISRQTVTARLRTAEERIGCSVVAHASEIGTALRLEELGYL